MCLCTMLTMLQGLRKARCQVAPIVQESLPDTRCDDRFLSDGCQECFLRLSQHLLHPTPPSLQLILLATVQSLAGGETACVAPHGLLHANSSSIRTVWNAVGTLGSWCDCPQAECRPSQPGSPRSHQLLCFGGIHEGQGHRRRSQGHMSVEN